MIHQLCTAVMIGLAPQFWTLEKKLKQFYFKNSSKFVEKLKNLPTKSLCKKIDVLCCFDEIFGKNRPKIYFFSPI